MGKIIGALVFIGGAFIGIAIQQNAESLWLSNMGIFLGFLAMSSGVGIWIGKGPFGEGDAAVQQDDSAEKSSPETEEIQPLPAPQKIESTQESYNDIYTEGHYQLYLIDAEAGDSNAQFNLGFMFANGKVIPLDYKESEQGDAKALFNLGVRPYKDHGVEQDYKEAVKWYRKAAEQGHAKAQYNLGVMYYKGRGVEQDYKEAVVWYKKAAERGDIPAQYILGTMYNKGQGVIEDFVESYKWFLLAGMNGKDVADVKQTLKTNMTPEQIAQAQKQAKAFIGK